MLPIGAGSISPTSQTQPVSVTSATPGTGTANLGKAEDAPFASGDTGVLLLAVRNSSGSLLANSEGDYTPIAVDSAGRVLISQDVSIIADVNSVLQDVVVKGNVAHDAVDSDTFPVKVGGLASSAIPAAVSNGDRVNAYFDTFGRLYTVTSTKVALTASSPTAVTVGVSSAQAIASNSSRKGLVLVNTSGNTISLGLGATAVLNSGITLSANGGSWTMDEYTFSTAAINAIASAGSSNLAIQEFT